MAQARVSVFYDISKYLTDKYFDIVWGCHPPETPQMDLPKNQIFERLNLVCQSVLISADIYLTIILTEFGGATPLGTPQMDPQKSIF